MSNWHKLFLGFFFATAPHVGAVEIELITVQTGSAPVVERSNTNPRISNDGRFVAFESKELSGSIRRNRLHDIFFYDRTNKSVQKMNPASGDRSNVDPFLSESGRFLVYASYSSSTIMGEPPLTSDFYVFDRLLRKSDLQLFDLTQIRSDGENLDASFSADGRYLLFTSNGSVYPGLKNGLTREAYLFDYQTRQLDLVSQNAAGEPANRPCGDARVSQNGRYVVFKSVATNLVKQLPPESLSSHLYLLNRRENQLLRVDDLDRGFDNNKFLVGRIDMDDKGERIVFEGRQRKSDDPFGTLNNTDLFLFKRSTGSVIQLTEGLFATRSHSPSLSADGQFMSFVFRGMNKKGQKIEGGIIVYDILSRRWVKVVNGSSVENPRLSGDGRFIVFESDQKNLVPGVKSNVFNIYVVRNPLAE